MAYRRIECRIWDDYWFSGLSPKAGAAFLWLLTSPTTTRAGIVELPRRPPSIFAPWSLETWDRALRALHPRILYCCGRALITRWLRYQVDGPRGAEGALAAALREPAPVYALWRSIHAATYEANGWATPPPAQCEPASGDTLSIPYPYPMHSHPMEYGWASRADPDPDPDPDPEKNGRGVERERRATARLSAEDRRRLSVERDQETQPDAEDTPEHAALVLRPPDTREGEASANRAKTRPRNLDRERAIRQVWEHWLRRVVAERGRDPARYKLDTKRRAKISARLAEGFLVSEVCAAIDGGLLDGFLSGDNDRNREYLGIETVLRDRAQVERLRDLAARRTTRRGPTPPRPPEPPEPREPPLPPRPAPVADARSLERSNCRPHQEPRARREHDADALGPGTVMQRFSRLISGRRPAPTNSSREQTRPPDIAAGRDKLVGDVAQRKTLAAASTPDQLERAREKFKADCQAIIDGELQAKTAERGA